MPRTMYLTCLGPGSPLMVIEAEKSWEPWPDDCSPIEKSARTFPAFHSKSTGSILGFSPASDDAGLPAFQASSAAWSDWRALSVEGRGAEPPPHPARAASTIE